MTDNETDAWADRLHGRTSGELHSLLVQFAEVIRAERPEPPAYPIPGPYEIALQIGAALVASGKFETPGAALHAAWAAVPEYFQGRDFYLREIAPVYAGFLAVVDDGGEANGRAAG